MKFAQLTQEVQVTRPTDVKFDLGLTPGRRRVNQMYKDAIKQAEENGSKRTFNFYNKKSNRYKMIIVEFELGKNIEYFLAIANDSFYDNLLLMIFSTCSKCLNKNSSLFFCSHF